MLNHLKRILGSYDFKWSLSSAGSVEWNSVRIVYRHPHVDRLWKQIDDEHRLFLHRIHPVPSKKVRVSRELFDSANDALTVPELRAKVDDAAVAPLWHPHSWPSAMYIVDGSYRMKIGTSEEKLATVELSQGSFYEMLNPHAFHSVEPLNGRTVLTVMLTSKPWERGTRVEFEKPASPQQPMSGQDVRDLLAEFYEAGAPGSHNEDGEDGNAQTYD